MKKVRGLASLILTLLMIPALSCAVFAEEPGSFDMPASGAGEVTEVKEAGSAEELLLISDTGDNEAFFTIDASEDAPPAQLSSETVSRDVEEVLSGSGSIAGKKEEIVGILEDSGLYSAAEGSGSSVEVSSDFAYKRLILVSDMESEINAYGALTAAYYDDHYLLTYGSEEAAKAAYEALINDYGSDAVFIDRPLRMSGYTEPHGWGTAYMGLGNESKIAANGASVTVAVLDTGIMYNHEVFGGKTILRGYDFVNLDSDPYDDSGHGTAVCGVLSESTPSNVRILPVKILDENGEASIEMFRLGIEYADEQGADIINISLGGPLSGADKDLQYYERVFSRIRALMICASGNEGMNLDRSSIEYFPAELSCAVCVAAVDTKLRRPGFSNYGSAVDFAAPGYDVEIAALGSNPSMNNYYRKANGTSFATPYISAAAALLKAENSGISNSSIVSELVSCSIDLGKEGRDAETGFGCPVFDRKSEPSGSGDLSKNTYTVGFESEKSYTGKAIWQNVSLICNGNLLKEGRDYTTEYYNNTETGTAMVIFEGIGNYSGSSKEMTFRIIARKITPSVILSGSSYRYTGGRITPSVKVMDGNTVLDKGVDYTVKYPEGRTLPGKYKVSVVLKGNYSGSGSASFTINKLANGMKLKKKTAKATVKRSKLRKKAQTVKLSKFIKVSGASGKVSFSKAGGSGKLSVSGSRIRIKKNTKKGTYTIKLRVSASGDTLHSAAAKAVSIKIKVK